MKTLPALCCTLACLLPIAHGQAESVFEMDDFGNINQRNIGVMEQQELNLPGHITSREQETTRPLPDFNGLRVDVPVDVEYRRNGAAQIKIEGSQASIAALDISVQNRTLVIAGNAARITDTPRLTIQGGNLEHVRINSPSDIELNQVQTRRFELVVRSAADVRITGRADQCSIDSQGAGDIDQSDLHCQHLNLKVFGANDIQAYASRGVSGRLQGAGDLVIVGNPARREVKVQGAFDVEYF